MSDSNSYVQESIYESQTRSIKIIPAEMNISSKKSIIENQAHPIRPSAQHISLPTKENIRKSDMNKTKAAFEVQLVQKDVIRQPTLPKLDQEVFIRYYEQNLELKKKQEQMTREIKELRQKVYAKDDHTRLILEQQLKALAQGKKSEWDQKQPLGKQKRGVSANKNLSTKKVQHLLEIIDHYKAKLITAEEEVTNLKRQKYLLEQDVKLRDKQVVALKEDKPQKANFQEQINLSDKLKRSIRELELEKERVKFLEVAVKSLQTKLKTSQMKAQQIDMLKAENRALEEKVIRMTQLPSFSNVVDKAQEERRVKQLESKLKLINEKYNSLRDNSFKTEADLKILQNKLIESTHEITVLQRQNEALRAQSVNNPLLLKLNQNPELLQQVLIEIQNKKRSAVREPQNAKNKIQKLILEKQELARQILNYEARIQTLQESFKERQKLSKLQKPESVVGINQGKITSKTGVIYDGDISVFSEQNINIPPGTNYFDVYLGEVSLMETMVQTVTGLTNPSTPLLLATVDFYNHNTQSSKLAQGCRCDLRSQIFFKVNQDDFFLKYLQKNTFQVDVWASEGNKHYHLGKASIDLKHLITKARPRVSPVISTSAPLYLNQKMLGSINMIMRMRLPIYDQVQRLLRDGAADIYEEGKQQRTLRRLVIQIDEGRGFGDKANTFVYFPFRLEDHYTRASKGNSPNWSYIKMLEVNYDSDLKNYLRKGEIEFVVFDDNVVVMDDKNIDVVGSAILTLSPLLEGKPIREKLEIRKGNQRKGTIDVKIFWYQVQDNKQLQLLEEERRLGPQGVHQQIRSFMKDHNIDAEKVFRLMDDNKTGLISYDEFQEWLFKISARKFTAQSVAKYYKGFKEPVNLKNFVMRITQQFDAQSQKQIQGVAAGIGMINQFLKVNTTQIKKTSLEDYLQGKNVVQLINTIQTDRAGYISRQKLQEFLDQNGLEAQITGERIKLIDFLRRHQRLTLTL